MISVLGQCFDISNVKIFLCFYWDILKYTEYLFALSESR